MTGKQGSAASTPTSRSQWPRDAAAAADAQQSRNRRLVIAIAGVAAAAVVGGIAWTGLRGSANTLEPSHDLAAVSGLGQRDAPPWPAPDDVAARAKAAGMPLGPMGTAEHYHAHLDVIVNGDPAAIPANIGVDTASGQMSALHTHTPDGIIHIESPRAGQLFTLGQLFTEWDVALGADYMGDLTADGPDGNTLSVYVNGDSVDGDPALLRLEPEQQIALVFGPADQKVDIPATFDWDAAN